MRGQGDTLTISHILSRIQQSDSRRGEDRFAARIWRAWLAST